MAFTCSDIFKIILAIVLPVSSAEYEANVGVVLTFT